jgi:poly-beta-1,6-N-acetyl-D-glucosamine synthase
VTGSFQNNDTDPGLPREGKGTVKRIVALVPSHNEEASLPAALRSLEEQTVSIGQIVVVSDNSTDGTASLAAQWGRTVSLFETRGNRDKKAGALNQALSSLLPTLFDHDFVLVMDADSSISPGFVARALALMEADSTVGAVGGIFLATGAHSLLERLQANEYVRYAREIARDHAKARVLTGTATFARVGALRSVQTARSGHRLPG